VKLRVNCTSQRKFIYAEKVYQLQPYRTTANDLVKSRKKVGTWNMLSLYTRSEVLRNLMEVTQEYGTDLLAVQKIRWLGKTIMEKKDCMVYNSSHDKQHCLDMGFTVSEHLRIQVMN
jgi:hypothetical protein